MAAEGEMASLGSCIDVLAEGLWLRTLPNWVIFGIVVGALPY